MATARGFSVHTEQGVSKPPKGKLSNIFDQFFHKELGRRIRSIKYNLSKSKNQLKTQYDSTISQLTSEIFILRKIISDFSELYYNTKYNYSSNNSTRITPNKKISYGSKVDLINPPKKFSTNKKVLWTEVVRRTGQTVPPKPPSLVSFSTLIHPLHERIIRTISTEGLVFYDINDSISPSDKTLAFGEIISFEVTTPTIPTQPDVLTTVLPKEEFVAAPETNSSTNPLLITTKRRRVKNKNKKNLKTKMTPPKMDPNKKRIKILNLSTKKSYFADVPSAIIQQYFPHLSPEEIESMSHLDHSPVIKEILKIIKHPL